MLRIETIGHQIVILRCAVLECIDSDNTTVEYDSLEAQCCGGNVYLKSENESCCTGVPYQDEFDICCIDDQGVGHLDTRVGVSQRSVKRFERSNGLDTALYKTIPLSYSSKYNDL